MTTEATEQDERWWVLVRLRDKESNGIILGVFDEKPKDTLTSGVIHIAGKVDEPTLYVPVNENYYCMIAQAKHVKAEMSREKTP